MVLVFEVNRVNFWCTDERAKQLRLGIPDMCSGSVCLIWADNEIISGSCHTVRLDQIEDTMVNIGEDTIFSR